MRMLLEEPSLIEVAPHRHTPASGIVRYARACAVLIAGVIGVEAVHAEDAQKAGEILTIDHNIKQLDNPDFTTRNDAEEWIVKYVNDTIDKQNPPPIDLHQLFSPTPRTINTEKGIRLQRILAQTEEAMFTKPGRILSSNTLNIPLYKILEQQFNRSIIVHDPSLQECLEGYYTTEDSRSTEALMKLCLHLQCVPIFSATRITLEPMGPFDTIRCNDNLILVTRMNGEVKEETLEYAPNKGVILLKKYDNKLSEKPQRENQVIIGSRPKTIKMKAENNEIIRYEDQSFFVNSIEEINDKHTITIHGSIDVNQKIIDRLKMDMGLYMDADMDLIIDTPVKMVTIWRIYECVRSNLLHTTGIIPVDSNGVEIPIENMDCTYYFGGKFEITIVTNQKMEELFFNIFGTTRMETIQIPE